MGKSLSYHLFWCQIKNKSRYQYFFTDTGVELELLEEMPFLEWMANNYKNFGANLEIITDRSQEGSQFVKGFGGIGGILRYKVDFQNTFKCDEFEDEDFDLDDY